MDQNKFSIFAFSTEEIIAISTLTVFILFKKYTKLFENKKLNSFIISLAVVYIFFFLVINLFFLYRKYINFNIIIIIFSVIISISLIIYIITMNKLSYKVMHNVKNNAVFRQIFTTGYFLTKYKIHLNLYLYDKIPTATGIITKDNFNLIINQDLYETLNGKELSLLALHEFAHKKYYHQFKKFLINFIAICLFIFAIIINFTTSYLIFIKIIFLLMPIIYFFLLFLMHDIISLYFEKKADRFALGIMRDNTSLITLIEKAYQLSIKHYSDTENEIVKNHFLNTAKMKKMLKLRIKSINKTVWNLNETS